MQIYDLSLSISDSLPVWPGDPRVKITQVSSLDAGDIANVSRIEMGVHTGTHVDAPYHFMGGDTKTVENLSLEVMVGTAQVIQLPDDITEIGADILENAGIYPGAKRLLIRTRNSRQWEMGNTEFFTSFTAIKPDGAQYLVDRKVQLVGVDYLSVALYEDQTPTHRILLGASVVIIEGLNLSQVQPGIYNLVCLPLKIGGSDGSPARVILIGD